MFFAKTKEYSSDCPYAKKISVKEEHTYSAAAFMSLMALRSFGFLKLWMLQNLVNALPFV